MFMVLLVLNDVGRLDDTLEAWTELGVLGVTAVEGIAARRRRTAFGSVHPRHNVENLGVGAEQTSFTLFGIVSDETEARRCLAATESVVGDLAAPGVGVWACAPLALVKCPPHATESGVT